MNKKPLISIITVVYNDRGGIENTIKSVINQTYEFFEYIIVDGGSTDGTLDIVLKYQDRLSSLVSEPDNGIYDAMNKGLRCAKGEWISFMNSGDTFYDYNVLERVFGSFFQDNVDVIYGDVILRYKRIGDIIKTYDGAFSPAIPINLCHQATFTKGSLMKKYGFDTSFRIAADANFFERVYREECAKFGYVKQIIAVYEAEDGLSARNLTTRNKEFRRLRRVKRWSIEWFKDITKSGIKVLFYKMPSWLRDIILRRKLLKLYNQETDD